MPLELNAPLIIIDTETTGTAPKVDRVIQIGLIKRYPDDRETEWQTYVNPGVPIPPEATAVHGITDEKVKDSPFFKDLAGKLAAGFKGCDFCGFNVGFDLRMLRAEFVRVGMRPDFINGRIIDGYDIACKYKPRTLTAMVKEELGEDLEGAHDALVDVRATWRLVKAQLERYENGKTVEQIHREYYETPAEGDVDADGRLRWRNGEACLAFGKHGETATPLRSVPDDYLRWIIANDFPQDLKRICQAALKGIYPKRTP